MVNTLDHDSIVPLYEQVLDKIKREIAAGVYKEDGRLPTETELADLYQVSRITIRRAVNELVDQKLVEKKQGKGTFIAKPKFSRNMKKLQSFSEMCEQMGVKPGAQMLENRLICADEKIAKSLEIETGSKVIYISRLRFADGEPVQIERSYFPLKYAYLLEAKFDDNSLFDYLYETGRVKVSSSEKVIELCRATEEEARLLQIERNDYLLFVKSTAYDKEGSPLYAGIQIINGDRFSLYVYEKGDE